MLGFVKAIYACMYDGTCLFTGNSGKVSISQLISYKHAFANKSYKVN